MKRFWGNDVKRQGLLLASALFGVQVDKGKICPGPEYSRIRQKAVQVN